ncbi:hypothetical protein [Desulfovibrio sp. DV]|uniref:hypothetical protein n=1 Tax=Desulfovibrio sp. DV TaxID=1844708 RepID=UPI00094B9BD0|nr:hypothetical protein [Desulfovibrio sp. DV]
MPTPRSDHNPMDASRAVLELATRDALAALRHVAACLARRSHELLGLTCEPGVSGPGRLLVTVADDGRLDRLVAELRGLPEVCGARLAGTAAGCGLRLAEPAAA